MWGHEYIIERHLAGGDKPLVIDFTVFAMGVVTLAFILVVEVIRHKIDHYAKGKHFFSSVLDSVYRELSTLGLVEAGVFLLHHYYADLNIEVERVFAEVHFALFFVAIINAIQSVILFHFTSRVAFHNWVRMEDIDIDHYIAIRRQFETIDKQMGNFHGGKNTMHQWSMSKAKSQAHLPVDELYASGTGFNERWYNLRQFFSHPALYHKHRRLLVQVRFHELRVHFIESNKLPPKFHVSAYLLLSLNDVFHDLVHISTFAWVILIGVINVIHFIMGIVAYKTESEQAIGSALSLIYVLYCVVFFLFSLIIARKMNNIFYRIMKDEKWANLDTGVDADDQDVNNLSQPGLAMSIRSAYSKKAAGENVNQLDLFWFSDPKLIIVACQMMQFGFAIAFAILLVFNQSFSDDGSPSSWWGRFIVVPILCYIGFLWAWSLILPAYTQCTSLGELIQRKHLVDTEAQFRLDEAKKHRLEEIDQIEVDKAHANKRSKTLKKKRISMVRHRQQPDRSVGFSRQDSEKRLNQLSEFVKKATVDLPPLNIKSQRKRRVKSVSDGVGSMRLFPIKSASFVAQEALSNDLDDSVSMSIPFHDEVQKGTEDGILQRRRNRKKAFSTGVLQMQQISDNDNAESEIEEVRARSSISKTLAPLCEIFPPSSASLQLKGPLENNKEGAMKHIPQNEPRSKSLTGLQIRDDLKINYAYAHDDESIQSEKPSLNEEDDQMSDGVPDIVAQDDLSEEVLSRAVQIQNILSSPSFHYLNAVFGTLVLFYNISIRVEKMLIEWCIIPDNSNTWDLISREGAFWIEFVYMLLFITEAVTTVVIFWGIKPQMVIAGIFDFILSSTCFILLIVAETRRCCEEKCDPNPGLPSYVIAYGIETKYDLTSECKLPPDNFECCSRFGSRFCGSVGNVEPFTALIVLRILRFSIGNQLTKLFMPYQFNSKREGISQNKEHHSEIEIGTIAELWRSAIEKHPDIVEKHGLFSGRLLEAMLGIEELPVIQSLSNPVSDLQDTPGEGKYLGKIYEKEKKPTPARSASIRSLSGGGSIRDLDGFDLSDIVTELARPNATLIRSMRRCQCKMLPLLDEWTTVDVVLTKYEIVWFDTSEREEDLLETPCESKLNGSRGKGQQLCDVAQGRVPLGHLLLSEINFIKIQRTPPSKTWSEDLVDQEEDEETDGVRYDMKSEYWSNRSKSDDGAVGGRSRLPTQTRWDLVTEDKLKLVTAKGTLYLRFLVDLKEQEANAEGNAEDLISKQGCVLWCQSISHLCGTHQLKQNLPNFGEATDDEISDFIEVTSNNRANNMLKGKSIQIRMSMLTGKSMHNIRAMMRK